MAITADCEGGCEVQHLVATQFEPAEYCFGDSVPHSDLCKQHGGEADLEAFMDEWEEWLGDEPCGCVQVYLQ